MLQVFWRGIFPTVCKTMLMKKKKYLIYEIGIVSAYILSRCRAVHRRSQVIDIMIGVGLINTLATCGLVITNPKQFSKNTFAQHLARYCGVLVN